MEAVHLRWVLKVLKNELINIMENHNNQALECKTLTVETPGIYRVRPNSYSVSSMIKTSDILDEKQHQKALLLQYNEV